MHNNLSTYLILTCIIIFYSLFACDEAILVEEGGFTVIGTVLDSTSHQPIPEVLVGFRDTYSSDSVFFVGDSLDLSRNILRDIDHTDSSGSFYISIFATYRDSTRYQAMIAWKTGYKLWRYDHSPANRIWISEGIDELTIYLTKK